MGGQTRRCGDLFDTPPTVLLAVLAVAAAAPPLAAQQAPGPASAIRDEAPPALQADAVELPGGLRLHVVTQGPADAPVIVLLHGYTDSWQSFGRVLPLLPADRRVVVPDLRGHGDSSRPAAGYAMDDLAADVIALMDVLDIPAAVVVGHSMGSLVAQRIAATAPERVEALVLVGGAPSIHGLVGLEEFRAAVEALEDPVDEPFVRAFQEGTVLEPLPPEFLDRAVAESLRLPARVWKALLNGMLEMAPSKPGELTAPTLLLYGSGDPIFPRDQQDRLLELIPDARLEVFPGVGHAPHWEMPERFTADLVAFLAGRPAATP